MLRRRELQAWRVLIAGLAVWPALTARAHPSPAAVPEFGPPDCITVLDKQKSQVFAVQYFLGSDDTAPEPDHIMLADSKTHQFYAFRGQLAANDPDYALYPFDPALTVPLVLPTWINQDDLLRSEKANSPMIAPDFTAAAIGGDTLQQRPDLRGQWLAATSQRVPITVAQSRLGAIWDLRAVQPGIYQVAAYIFSPPYNGWEPRPGIVKVTDGMRDVPAITLEPVDASLFAGQGRKLTGCVNAPSGSQLRAWSRPADDPSAPWQLWATEPLADGARRFDLCYRNPRPGRSGILQLRVSAVSPSGDETAAYALDQLTLVAQEAACTESSKLCCEPLSAATSEATATATLQQANVSAGAPAPPPSAAGASAPTPAAPAPAPPPPSQQQPAPAAKSGCSIAAGAERPLSAWYALALAAACLRAFRRRSCRSDTPLRVKR